MHYFLGIDGGASKTRAVLITDTGTIMAHESGPGSSIIAMPHPGALDILGGMARALCKRAGIGVESVAVCGLGLNGIDFADEIPDQHAALAAGFGLPADRLVLVNDGIVALWGASPTAAAAILQHGSAFTGGYRTRFGDETLFDHLGVGRVFDLRYELATLVARMLDGRAEPTPLLDTALAHYGVTADTYAEALFRQWIPSDKLRGTAPLIFAAWQNGDPAGESLVQCALEDYAITAKALVRHTGSDAAEIAFGGGVLRQAPQAFWEILAERVQRRYPHATVKSPDLPPEYGAAIMAAFHAGIPPVPLFTTLKEAICETA
jgi:N-acetylglucosamine kinase-like BadF-type ATPase